MLAGTWRTSSSRLPVPVGGKGGGSLISGGGFGGGITDLFGSLISGFKADGGPVSAGRLYQVNERGPELLNVGNRQFLMMGNQGGTVTPNGGTQAGNTVNVSNQFTLSGPVDRRTQMEIARMAGAAVQRATARNG